MFAGQAAREAAFRAADPRPMTTAFYTQPDANLSLPVPASPADRFWFRRSSDRQPETARHRPARRSNDNDLGGTLTQLLWVRRRHFGPAMRLLEGDKSRLSDCLEYS